jgi:hypothetical protein
MFRITTVGNANFPAGSEALFGTDWTDELTAVFDITVTQKSGGPGAWTFDFGPTAGFGSAAGVMIKAFTDPLNDFNAGQATTALSLATAANGAPYWELGFLGLPGEFWTATVPTDDIAALALGGVGINVGTANFWLNLIVQQAGPDLLRARPGFLPMTFVDLQGQGNFFAPDPSVVGAQTAANFQVQNDVNAFFVPIPEPATLGLLGAGLIGLAALGRKRIFKK